MEEEDVMQQARQRRPRAVFMAFGTQGDVYPLAALAAGLGRANHHCSIFFITHAAHESLMRPLSSLGIVFVPVASPPVLSATCLAQIMPEAVVQESMPRPKHTTETFVKEGASHLSDGWKLKVEQQHREECLKAVDRIMGSEPRQNEDFIIINFFALEGWHLAELYQVPCVVAAPYMVPYSAPVSFERRFRSSHPLLYDNLKRAIPGKVGWDDVIHWMWPLFTERWMEWRVRQLHLSPCPLTDPVTELPVAQSWPAEPLLLYGFSKEVVECPSYWPCNVHVCGFWFWESNIDSHMWGIGSQSSISPELISFLRASNTPPIFIGLSSIGSMGLLDNPEGMLCVLGAFLQAADRKAILFTASYSPLDAAVLAAATQAATSAPKVGASESSGNRVQTSELYDGQSNDLKSLGKGVRVFGDRLFCFSGSVPYLWLFPKCSLIIHHGGSGTTAAALQSGIPQVICPFILDQFYWAERMAWIGVAPDPLEKQHLIPPENREKDEAVRNLLRAVKEASSPKLQACAAALGERIRKEDGVENAIEVLCRQMCI